MSKILVADDERDILDTTAELLRAYGHEVMTVQQTKEVLSAMRTGRPDVLLQDCAMPGLDLSRLVREIRADEDLREIPILLFTGSVDARATAQRMRVEGYIEKPFDMERLQHQIQRVLSARKKR